MRRGRGRRRRHDDWAVLTIRALPLDGLEDPRASKKIVDGIRESRPRRRGRRRPSDEDKIIAGAQFGKAMAHGVADTPLHQVAYHRFPHPLSY